jgi:hypothetical protein
MATLLLLFGAVVVERDGATECEATLPTPCGTEGAGIGDAIGVLLIVASKCAIAPSTGKKLR